MSKEINIEQIQKRVQLLLASIKVNMYTMWPKLSPVIQTKFKLFNKQDWRDFAQTLLEATYKEYAALDGYYLPPDAVHALQELLDDFAETFPSWFKENFNGQAKKDGGKKETE